MSTGLGREQRGMDQLSDEPGSPDLCRLFSPTICLLTILILKMDIIRISDAAFPSARRSPSDERPEEMHQEEDSIDLIDKELRRILDSKGSDQSKEPSNISKFSSYDIKDKFRGGEQPEDRFASLMEQMEMAINAESLKPGQEFVNETKTAKTSADGKANSKWKVKKEVEVVEKRKTLVKGKPPAGGTEKENVLPTAQKANPPKGWGSVEGKRVVLPSAKQILIPLSGHELRKTDEESPRKGFKQEDFTLSMIRESKSRTSLANRETEHSEVMEKTKERENLVKKPRLISEESYLGDQSANDKGRINAKPSTRAPIKAESKPPEATKESKLQIQNTLLSPIARITDQTDTKGSVQNLFSEANSSPLRHLNSGQKEQLAACTADMKVGELNSKLTFINTHMKHQDCLIFTKLVLGVAKEFAEDKDMIRAKKEYLDIVAQMDGLAQKAKELNKVLQSLSLTQDAKLTSAIVESLAEDISSITDLIIKIQTPSKVSFKPFGSSDPSQKAKGKANLFQSQDENPRKGDELEIYLKKSTEKLVHSRESLSAKLDFDELIADNQKMSVDTLPMRKEMAFYKKTPQDNCEIGHRRTYSRGTKEEKKEAESILTQKFGCKVYCIKLIARKLVCGFEDGTLSIFKVNKNDGLCLEKSGKLHPRPISSIACTSPEQRRSLIFTGYSGSSSCSIVVWDSSSLKPLKELCGHESTVSGLHYILPNYLISTSFDRKVIFWDLGECEAVLSSETHQTPIISSYYHNETSCLYTGSLDGIIIVTGLVIDHRELTDIKILKKIIGQGPILNMACCLDDKILTLQNSRLIIYDSRGYQTKELKTNTMPVSVVMVDEEKGYFVDAEGKPYPIDLPKDFENRRDCGFSGSSMDKSSLVLGTRLNGANCQVQIFFDGSLPIVISSNEKLDALSFFRIK
jgi:WD40 repeat protein